MRTTLTLILVLLPGCVAGKLSDTNRYIDGANAPQHVTYTVVPGSIAGMPENAIALPTIPGKNVVFRSYHPNGQLQWELETDRSDVLDTIGRNVTANDAAKLAELQLQRQWISDERDAIMSFAQPFIAPTIAQLQAAADQRIDLANRRYNDNNALRDRIADEVSFQLRNRSARPDAPSE